MNFDLHIGIDYSGARTPNCRMPALQVYAGMDEREPRRIWSPASSEKTFKNWTRKEIAAWIIEQAQKNYTFIAGLDHGFSFPVRYFERYHITSWPEFLDDFCEHWPTGAEHRYVEDFRDGSLPPPERSGCNKEFRLTEQWTSSAKSVFQFDVQGAVAKSTHAGLPWLQKIRDEVGDKVHFWPLDGWEVPKGKSVLAEIYPSIFSRRYPRDDRKPDQQDAYSVARWLMEMDRSDFLPLYFAPPLLPAQKTRAHLEGWILGIM